MPLQSASLGAYVGEKSLHRAWPKEYRENKRLKDDYYREKQRTSRKQAYFEERLPTFLARTTKTSRSWRCRTPKMTTMAITDSFSRALLLRSSWPFLITPQAPVILQGFQAHHATSPSTTTMSQPFDTTTIHLRKGNTIYGSSSTSPLEECLTQLLPQELQRAPQISLTVDIPSKAFAGQGLPEELQFEYAAAAQNRHAGAVVMAPVFLRGLARQWENVVGTWPSRGWEAAQPLGEGEREKGYRWGLRVEVVMPRDGQWEEEEGEHEPADEQNDEDKKEEEEGEEEIETDEYSEEAGEWGSYSEGKSTF